MRMVRPRRLTSRQVLAANVRQERARVQWSQEELGSRARISQTYVSQVESGQRAVSIDVLDQLADAFSLDPSQLLRRR